MNISNLVKYVKELDIDLNGWDTKETCNTVQVKLVFGTEYYHNLDEVKGDFIPEQISFGPNYVTTKVKDKNKHISAVCHSIAIGSEVTQLGDDYDITNFNHTDKDAKFKTSLSISANSYDDLTKKVINDILESLTLAENIGPQVETPKQLIENEARCFRTKGNPLMFTESIVKFISPYRNVVFLYRDEESPHWIES